MLSGCAGSFQAKDTVPVDASVTVNAYQIVEGDVGVLYDWFAENNAFTPDEAARVNAAYTEIVRVISKLRTKTIAGQVDYHRLLYATEDLTEAWQILWPELNKQIDAVMPATRQVDKFAISMWNRIKMDMDSLLQANNLRLKAARGEMDAATYAAFKEDAKSIVKTLSPLLKSGIALF
jgi:hypothetical protein